MQFLYPQSNQYPFDEVATQIVHALEERNWQVPGIEVGFGEYGTGEAKFRLVRTIEGDGFRIRFGRLQGRLEDGRWNDTAAVTGIFVPKMEIHVYDDESGPSFYTYVGSDWEKDRDEFMRGMKVNSKLNGKPRTYLKYKGACNCQHTRGASFPAVGLMTALVTDDRNALARMNHTHSGRRSPLLVHDNDLDREHELEEDDQDVWHTAEVFNLFTEWLQANVLARIQAEPVPNERIDVFPDDVAIPLPDELGALFAFGEYRDNERITKGQEDPSRIEASDRYGLQGGGYRLASSGTRGDFPKVAYDGFLWCGIGEVTSETTIESLEVPGNYRWSDRQHFVIRVKPDRANGVYIADHAAYEKRRKELGGQLGDRVSFTNAEVDEMQAARAATIVPIVDYNGEFEQPVVLINRELSLDEVEMVSGPHKDWPGR